MPSLAAALGQEQGNPNTRAAWSCGEHHRARLGRISPAPVHVLKIAKYQWTVLVLPPKDVLNMHP